MRPAPHSPHRPRWHAIVRRFATPALGLVLFVYALSPYVGFIAKDAGGPIFLLRPGAIGVGYLTRPLPAPPLTGPPTVPAPASPPQLPPLPGLPAPGQPSPPLPQTIQAFGPGHIQDIPSERYIGHYFPTTDPIWKVLLRNDAIGVRFYLPYWVPLVMIIGLIAWVKLAGHTRSEGACPACGYNLEGCVVEACGRCGIAAVTCPECGVKTPRALGQDLPATPG